MSFSSSSSSSLHPAPNGEHHLEAALRETEAYYQCQLKQHVPPEAALLIAWMKLTNYNTKDKIQMIQEILHAANIRSDNPYDPSQAHIYYTLSQHAQRLLEAAHMDDTE